MTPAGVGSPAYVAVVLTLYLDLPDYAATAQPGGSVARQQTSPAGGRPAWMDIRLDDPEDLARNHTRFQPVVLRSLLGAGYRRLGDLRWVPSRELMNLHYVGFKWAAKIRAVVRRLERDPSVATP